MNVHAPEQWLEGNDSTTKKEMEMKIEYKENRNRKIEKRIKPIKKTEKPDKQQKNENKKENKKKKKQETGNKGVSPDDQLENNMEHITPIQSKYQPEFRGRMRPDPSIEHHPAFGMLFKYATEGCPVDCGEPWTREHLEAAILRGPHISAKSTEATTCLREEALEKVKQGYVEIVNWDDIKESHTRI